MTYDIARGGPRVVLGLLALMAGGAAATGAQDPGVIAAVDLYGRFVIPDSAVRAALGIAPGDPVPDAADAAAAVRRVESLPGVTAVHLAPVCCDDGGTLLYVGIETTGAASIRFRDPPAGDATLPAEVIVAGEAFDRAFLAAIEAGDFAESDSLGHALMHHPAARRVQERFVPLADQYGDALRSVLRASSDPAQRALAAQVLAYATDKRDVVADLAYAISDPSAGVRNNAVRALALIAGLAERRKELGIGVPYEPFIGLLRSPVWTDRNKASLALMQLTAARDSQLLAALGRDVLPELRQMARWHNIGHATPALLVLGRIGGLSEQEIVAALQRGDRELLIARASSGR